MAGPFYKAALSSHGLGELYYSSLIIEASSIKSVVVDVKSSSSIKLFSWQTGALQYPCLRHLRLSLINNGN